jgi:acyl-coenzyme A synthetase/AMP-(fatty) acid ligase
VEHQITFFGFTPSALSMFLAEKDLHKISSLKGVTCGGEVFSSELLERAYEVLKAQLFQVYGPTESSIDATHWVCSRDPSLEIVPLGRPLANIQVYLLDSHIQPVPPRVPAELYIGGIGLARGYLGRPDLTAEKFIPDPFSKTPGQRLYKTGDIARYLPDGNIEFLGRMDHQVKVRGFRIELEEVEHALEDHPDVLRAAVLPFGSNPSEKRLIAYVVRTGKLTASELRSFLKDRLPDYMIPSQIILLEHLPLTSSGKVDRGALPSPDCMESRHSPDFVHPRNEVEGLLANVWAEVLGVKQVGVHDNFFDLGGHSLSATRVISRLRNMKIELPIQSFFQTPTIAGLAMVIADGRQSNDPGLE